MAITDKVIELTPVNKKKNILFYIIMGVLLATTVLFLVMYLIKPNVTPGAVNSISVTHNLYVDENGNLVAAKGKEYVACAIVGYSGEVDTSVTWDLPGFDDKTPDTITNAEKESVKKITNASVGGTVVEDGDMKYIYCKFTPSNSTPNNSKLTITVLSGQTDKDGKSVIEVPLKVTVRDMGASDAEFTSIFPGSESDNPVAMNKISSREYSIDVPFVASRTRFNARINQASFGDNAVVSHSVTGEKTSSGDDIYTDSIVMSCDDESVVAMGMYQPKFSDRFSFDVKKVGSANITVKFNEYNSDEKFEIKLKVNVKTPEQMGIITQYRLFEETVGSTEPVGAGVKRIEMYVGQTYDLQSHIAVTPFARQNNWSKNIAPLAITEANSTVVSRAVLQTVLQNGNLALRADAAGSVKIEMKDRTPSGLSTSIEFYVDVKYRAASFGYYAKETDYNGVPSNSHSLTTVKGGNGSIDMYYVIPSVTADKVDGSQFLADVKVENPSSGVKIEGVNANGIAEITATQVYKRTNGAVIMHASLNYTLKDDIADGDVEIVITPLAVESQDAKLTVIVTPSTVASRIEFISAEDFDARFKATDGGLIHDYAKFEIMSVTGNAHKRNATLTLNMSGQSTNFTLGDLIKYTDDSGNDAGSTGRDRTSIRVADGENISLTGTVTLNMRMTPKILDSTVARATVTFTLSGTESSHNELELTVNLIDTPLELVLDRYADGMEYGYIDDPLSLTMPTVKQKYASGRERDPEAYSVAIFLNHRARFLTAGVEVDDSAFAADDNSYLSGSDKQSNSYVYFFTQDDFDAIGGNGASLSDMRDKAIVAVSGNAATRNKYVYLLKDLYALAMEGKIGGVDRIGMAFYPAGGDYNDDSVAAYFALTLTRKIDKLSVNGLTEGAAGNYEDYASGGSAVTVELMVHIRTGGDSTNPVYGAGILYGADSARYGNLERVTAVYNGQSYTDVLEFTMPQASDGGTSAVVEFRASYGKIRITYAVENKTLEVTSIKLYKDSAFTQEFADGEKIWLSAERSSADCDITVYYVITYPTDGKDYIKFDDVRFKMNNDDVARLVDSVSGDTVRLISKPGNPSETTDMTNKGSFVVRAGSSIGSVDLSLTPAIQGGKDSQTLEINVYAPSQGVMLGDFTNVGQNSLTMNITSDGETPSEELEVTKVFKPSEYYVAESGGTYFEFTVSDITDAASGGKVTFFYDRVKGALVLTSNGKAVSKTNVVITVNELIPDKGAAGTAGNKVVNSFTGSIDVEVAVSLYSLGISVGGNANPTAYNVETTGGSGTKSVAVSAVFNGGAAGVNNPAHGDVTFIVMKNKTPVAASDTSSAFNISGNNLVYDDAKLSIGSDLYELKAICDGKESAAVRLTLTTSKVVLRFDDANTRNVYDVSAAVDVKASVHNAGTNETVSGATVTYSVVEKDSDTVSNAATVSADGKVTVKISAGKFRIKASYGGISEYVTIKVNNKVVSIATSFEGQTAGTSANTVEIERIYDGTTATDITLSDYITLNGAGGIAPDGYEMVITPGSGSVFTVKDGVLHFTGTAGTQSFAIRVKSDPTKADYDIIKTVNVTAIVPQLTVNVDNGGTNSKTVNLMDDTVSTVYTLAVGSGVGSKYMLTDITLSGDELGAGKKFSYADGKLTLDLSKIDSTTANDLKTYTFTISAKVEGKTVAESARTTVSITLTADRTFSSPLFRVLDENNATVAGGSILTLGSGSYKTAVVGSYALSFTASGTAGATVPAGGGALTFTRVGSFTVSAQMNKYGKTFAAGSYSYGVKGDTNTITSSLSVISVEENGDETATAIVGSVAADYAGEDDKKIISYVVDFAGTGETFTLAELQAGLLKVDGGILSAVDGYPKLDGTTAEWRFIVDNPGDVSLWLSLTKNGRYYTASASNATFTMNGRPTGFTVSVNADKTFTPNVTTTADFVNGYEVFYDILSGDNLIRIMETEDGSGYYYTEYVTENGGTATVRATMRVAGGHCNGVELTYDFDITVVGITMSRVNKTSGEVFLNGADDLQNFYIADAFTVTDGDERDGYTVSDARIASGTSYASIEKLTNETAGAEKYYRVTAISTATGGEVKIEITVTFGGGKHGTYSETIEYTLVVLPSAQAASHDYAVTAGESLTLAMADAGSAKVNATYESVVGSIATIEGDVLVTEIGAGGDVTVTATPSVSGGIFGGVKQLKPVTFTVRVRGLALASGVELKLNNGGDRTFTAADFAFGGLGSNTASAVTAVSSDSDLIVVEGARVQAATYANVYTSDTAAAERVSKFVTVTVTARDSAFGTYVGEFDIEILPTVIDSRSSVSVNGAAVGDGELSLISGDEVTIGVELTASGYTLAGTPKAYGAECEIACETITGGIRIVCRYTAAESDEKLKITYALSAGMEITVFERELSVITLPTVTMSKNAVDTLAVVESENGETYNEYTFVSDGKFNKIVLDGLVGAVATASGADNVSGNVITVSAGINSLTVRVYATSAGAKSFTPKVTVMKDGTTTTAVRVLEQVAFTAVDLGELTAEAVKNGTAQSEFAIGDVVEIKASTENDVAGASFKYELTETVSGVSLKNELLTASEAGSYTVNVTVTAARLTLEKQITVVFASKPTLTVNVTGAGAQKSIEVTDKEEFEITYKVVSGKAYAVFGNITAGDVFNGTFTEKRLSADGTVVVEVSATVKNGAYRGTTLTRTVTHTVSKEDETQFEVTVTGSTLEWSDEFAVTESNVFVASGNATVTVDGNKADVTHTGEGDVTVIVIATLKDEESPYADRTYTDVVTVENDELIPQESDFAVRIDNATAAIEFVGSVENAELVSVTRKAREAEQELVTISDDKQSAEIDWKKLGGESADFVVTVKVKTDHYGDKTFEYTVTLQGISFEDGKLSAPAYMGGITSVTTETDGIDVIMESDGTLKATAEELGNQGIRSVEITVTVNGASFDMSVRIEVTEPAPEH